MLYGDLSNYSAPALAIHVDVFVEHKKKLFGLMYELKFNLSSRHLLELWFHKDLAIYLICTDEFIKRKKDLEELLDTYMVPYTRIIEVHSAPQLDFVLSANHIMGYFYKDHRLVDVRSNIAKHQRVTHIAEISDFLNGGRIK